METRRPRKIISPKRVEFLLDEVLYKEINKRAEEKRISLSEMLRRLVLQEVISWQKSTSDTSHESS